MRRSYALCLGSSGAGARDFVFGGGGNGDKVYHLAMNSYGQEMTECAAYFSLPRML
jgi:hypothetical protein